MRRRTKPRVVWLPQTNANSVGDGSSVYQLVTFGLLSGPTGQSTTTEIPLVADAQQGTAFVDDPPSLADIESSGYRLRRIVGKIWVQADQVAVDSAINFVVTAGIMVRHAETSSGASTAFQAGGENVNVGNIDNTGDPWIWRRSWWLGNRLADLTGTNNFFPRLNFGAEYPGGIAEGPHVDQKTARIVGPEERLFLDLTATVIGQGGVDTQSLTIAVLTDLRVLGSMRTSTGNRNNSSR